jgi:glycosyltransferase involved in cell wall biosynthesis
MYKILWRGFRADAFIILDTVSVALPAVLAGWLLFKKMVIRTGGDFVWEAYVERTKEKVLLSEFYRKSHALSRKERALVWLQKHVVFPLAHTVVFSTTWQRDIWAIPYAIPEHKTAVIENAFTPETNDTQVSASAHFVWVGRDIEVKNIESLDAALTRALQTCSAVELKILRNIPHAQVLTELRIARCLVIPSLSEVSPNVVLEALAIGTPAILTKDCGIRDRLGDSVTWIDPLSPDDIARAMCALMHEQAYGAAKERAKKFTFTQSYDDIAGEFLNVLA